MKIALAAVQFKVVGGKERDAFALARRLAARGHAVRFLASRPARVDTPAPVEVRPVQALSNHGRLAAFARAVAARSAAFDAVVTFDKLPGADFAYLADACWAAQPAGWWKAPLPRRRALLRIERALAAPPARTQLFFLTARQQAEYAAAYGVPPERSLLLPVVMHADRRPPEPPGEGRDETRRRLGIPPQAPLAVALAATNPRRKGLDRTLAALAAIPELHLLVAGGAPDRSFTRQAERLGVENRLHVLDYTPDVRPLLAAADLMIHPARVEAAGLVLVEALQAGLPVVATVACGYAPVVAQAGAGAVLAEPFRQGELEAATRAMLDRLAEMKARARAFAKRLVREPSWVDVIADRIEGGARR